MAKHLDIWIVESPCKACGGAALVDNPEWQNAMRDATPEQLEAGIKLKMPKRLTCAACHGLGTKMNDEFWRLRQLLNLAADVLGNHGH